MLGCVTPNLSIRFLKTSNAETIDSSTLVLITFLASALEVLKSITSLKVLFAKISGEANLAFPPSALSNSAKNTSK